MSTTGKRRRRSCPSRVSLTTSVRNVVGDGTGRVLERVAQRVGYTGRASLMVTVITWMSVFVASYWQRRSFRKMGSAMAMTALRALSFCGWLRFHRRRNDALFKRAVRDMAAGNCWR